ncbi:MAG: transcriptional regulator [Halobacteriovorax sp.]|nr:transcriptional regulator [Halobacteriovorax sp.]
MLYTVNIKTNLKDLRVKSEINQSEFARLCGVSRQTIHAIETSKYTPSVELALRIAVILNLAVEEIFSLNEV